MDTRFEFSKGTDDRIVYVRPVPVGELPADVRSHIHGIDEVYAVHDANGERLALVRDKRLAFALARQNDLAPVNVH